MSTFKDQFEFWWQYQNEAELRIFIHIPRTGGHSVKAVLRKSIGIRHLTHWPAAVIRNYLGEQQYNKSETLVVVRNTWDRLLSLYMHLKKLHGHSLYIKNKMKCAEKECPPILDKFDCSFEHFILSGEKFSWTISQLYFLCDGDTSSNILRTVDELGNTSWDSQDRYGKIIVDNILRFDTLKEDFARLNFSHMRKLERINKTKHEHYSYYYSGEMREVVRDRYWDEIERFGFTFKEENAMRVTFGDLKIGATARKNLQTVMDTNWASEGPMVRQFEKNWNDLFGYDQSVSMSSGTDACINACLVLYDRGAKRGDEIICPALTFVATVNAIVLAGFTPKFVDIDKNTLNIDPEKIKDALTDKTRGIMVTHTMGKPCDMASIMSIANERDLFVMEDSCEAHGAQIGEKYVGQFGHVSMFSFYTAHIVVAGEGGMCSTMYPEVADILRSVKSHGRKPGSVYFDFLRIGLNSKMNDLEAALGLEGVEQFNDTIEKRVKNRTVLRSLLEDLQDVLWLPNLGESEFVSPHAFPIVLRENNPDECSGLYNYLEQNSIQCKTLFGSMPTQHAAFEYLGHKKGDFPEAEFVGNNGLHFGIHQYLNGDDMNYVSDKIHAFLK